MKITCPKNQFLYGVNTVSKAVSNKTTMEILQCILIEAFDDCIKLTANDTELGIETVIQGTILEPGKIALEAKIFSEIIKKIPDNDVYIETDEAGKTNIECEQIQCSIMGRKGDDFSHLPEIEKENKYEVYGKKLQSFLDMIDSGQINEAENILLNNIDYTNKDEVMAAALFYQHLSEKDSEFLENNNYTKEEVLSGFKQLLVQSGYQDLFYMLKDDE